MESTSKADKFVIRAKKRLAKVSMGFIVILVVVPVVDTSNGVRNSEGLALSKTVDH